MADSLKHKSKSKGKRQGKGKTRSVGSQSSTDCAKRGDVNDSRASVSAEKSLSDMMKVEHETAPSTNFAEELDWCMEQLRLGLSCQKGTSRQMDEAARALRILGSSKPPLVKKRQVMQMACGDYRSKIAAERTRHIHSMTYASKTVQMKGPTAKLRGVCVRHATGSKNGCTSQKPLLTTDRSSKSQSTKGNAGPTPDEFKFNFTIS
uniref:Zgc:112185 n=1 Tax=Eptatretus burgeri TaxID=7764 RepID=A0A8C4WZ77_EPTBU